jgi:UDP-glucose 4-epimerase
VGIYGTEQRSTTLCVAVVFHLAAQSNVMGAVAYATYAFETNVQGTFYVLEAARKAAVRRVVFTSSREVNGDTPTLPVPETTPLRPKNSFGASKAAAEMYCRVAHENGVEVVVLRFANAYGLRDKDRVIPLFIENALHGWPLVLYGGSQIIDFISIETVVEILIKAGFGDDSPEPVIIGSGKGTTVADLANRVLQLTRSQSRLQAHDARRVEVSRCVANTTRAQKQFGLMPPDGPLFGLKDVVAWMRQQIPVTELTGTQ